jgi:hypothetical protein
LPSPPARKCMHVHGVKNMLVIKSFMFHAPHHLKQCMFMEQRHTRKDMQFMHCSVAFGRGGRRACLDSVCRRSTLLALTTCKGMHACICAAMYLFV